MLSCFMYKKKCYCCILKYVCHVKWIIASKTKIGIFANRSCLRFSWWWSRLCFSELWLCVDLGSLKMEAECFSGMFISTYESTRHQNTEEQHWQHGRDLEEYIYSVKQSQEVDWLMKKMKETYNHNHADFSSHSTQT
jgi:hypothetical protein